MIEHKAYIIDIDYWENDALLKIGDETFYFQFEPQTVPTLLDAIKFFIKDGKKCGEDND